MEEQREKRVIDSVDKLIAVKLNEFDLNLLSFSIANKINNADTDNKYDYEHTHNFRIAALRVTDIIFTNIEFKDFDFSKLKFEHCEFKKCTFINCIMVSTVFNYCKIKNCKFGYSIMTLSKMVECCVCASNFDMICFVGAQIINSMFIGDSINRCIFDEGKILIHDDSDSKLKTRIETEVPFYGNAIAQSSFSGTEINFDIFAVSDFFSRERLESGNPERNSLSGASLNNKAASTLYYPLSCPSEGEFIGWKKVKVQTRAEEQDADSYSKDDPFKFFENTNTVYYLVKLLIPADAKRSSATTYKCRCSKAKVLGIYNLDGTISDKESVTSTILYTRKSITPIEYKVGETVYPDKFDEDRWQECSNGIHFFIDREAARRYPLN